MASQSDPIASQAAQASKQPFDAVAEQYDRHFSDSTLGGWYRKQVWSVYARNFKAGDQILELGCGTGEDAVWLAKHGIRITATDASDTMISVARQKANAAGLIQNIRLLQFDLNSEQGKWPKPAEGELFDGIVANFGVLNCVEDRRSLASAMASSLRRGGKLVITVMGPLCLWEIGWHVLHGDFKRAFRRFRSGGNAHVGGGAWIRVWYPSARRLTQEFTTGFQVEAVEGVGILLPPPYLDRWADSHPALFNQLRKLDRQLAAKSPWPWLADHYTVSFTKI